MWLTEINTTIWEPVTKINKLHHKIDWNIWWAMILEFYHLLWFQIWFNFTVRQLMAMKTKNCYTTQVNDFGPLYIYTYIELSFALYWCLLLALKRLPGTHNNYGSKSSPWIGIRYRKIKNETFWNYFKLWC